MRSDSLPPAHYASLFRNGRNQAVRIPRDLEFDAERVRIFKDGSRLILEPIVDRPKLMEVLAEIGPIDEFPDVDGDLLPLDEPGV